MFLFLEKIVLNLLYKGGNENVGVVFFFFMISFCFFCMDVFFEYLWRINFMIFKGLNYVL